MVVSMVHYAPLSMRPQSIILVSNTLIASSTQKFLFITMLIRIDSDQIRMIRIDLGRVGVSLNLPSYWLFMTLLSSTSSWWIFHMMLHNKTSTCLSPLAAFSYAQYDQCDHSSYTETSEIKLCVRLYVCIRLISHHASSASVMFGINMRAHTRVYDPADEKVLVMVSLRVKVSSGFLLHICI